LRTLQNAAMIVTHNKDDYVQINLIKEFVIKIPKRFETLNIIISTIIELSNNIIIKLSNLGLNNENCSTHNFL